LNIRATHAADHQPICSVILTAKAHWGYSAAQMQQWQEDLLPSKESLEEWPSFLAEVDGQVVGFVQVDPGATPWELVSCFVQPAFMRSGIGAALLRKISEVAASQEQEVLHVDSDPNAESFYLSQGAISIGSVAAAIEGQPLRCRPQLRLPTQRGLTPRST
jgi:GNAT superfamily N-acetyltransferase